MIQILCTEFEDKESLFIITCSSNLVVSLSMEESLLVWFADTYMVIPEVARKLVRMPSIPEGEEIRFANTGACM